MKGDKVMKIGNLIQVHPIQYRVYWNRRLKKWSLQNAKTNKVEEHLDYVTLTDATLLVRKGTQERVRKEKKKYVHAFVVGYKVLEDVTTFHNLKDKDFKLDWQGIRYNPYKDDFFFNTYLQEEVPRDWKGNVHMEALIHENGIAPKVYI
tara:strand:+ start:167 stop:613 length:447 start_codon:yes stop_codon:yes gene_type:complete